ASYSRIIVYTDFQDDPLFQKVRAVNSRVEFIYYSRDDFFREFSIDKANTNIWNYIERYTHLCYIKLKIFELLARFRHVLFMDLDMYVRDNFDEIFTLDCDIAWRSGVTLFSKFSKSGLDIKSVPYLSGADQTTPAPNGGFILVNDSLDYEAIYQFSKDFFREYIGYFNSTIDEIVFAVAVLCKKLRLITLDRHIYNTPLQLFTEKTKIIHFIGRETKPWANLLFQRLFPGWLENYRRFAAQTQIVSDKVIDAEKTGATSCKVEFSYGDAQKYGIGCQIAPDRSVKGFLTFNSERYLFDAGTVRNLSQLACGSREDADALNPETLLAFFERLHEQLKTAARQDASK
ncbi:MAG: hypothetical protein IKX79_00465, partial [Desulfovibrionaceae bacterium]|nr:hypothetical protein [Desulfovibrionaceae bacterium]